jgi:hypothetical protein
MFSPPSTPFPSRILPSPSGTRIPISFVINNVVYAYVILILFNSNAYIKIYVFSILLFVLIVVEKVLYFVQL